MIIRHFYYIYYPNMTTFTLSVYYIIIMRTEFHAPDLISTLTFPTSSAQRQLSILTLATHVLLTAPSSLHHYNNGTSFDTTTHTIKTLQLILATMTFTRYHKIWYTLLDTRQQPNISTPYSPRHTRRRRL